MEINGLLVESPIDTTNIKTYVSLLTIGSNNCNISNLYISGNVRVLGQQEENNGNIHFSLLNSNNDSNFRLTNSIINLQELDIEYINYLFFINQGIYIDSIFQTYNLSLIYTNDPLYYYSQNQFGYQELTLFGSISSTINKLNIVKTYQEQEENQLIDEFQYTDLNLLPQLVFSLEQTSITDGIQEIPVTNIVIQINETYYGLCGYCQEFQDNLCENSNTCEVSKTEWLNITSFQKQSCTEEENLNLENIDSCINGVLQCLNGYGGETCQYLISDQPKELQEQINERNQTQQKIKQQSQKETNEYYNNITKQFINITSQLNISQPPQPQDQTDQLTNITNLTKYSKNINATMVNISMNATMLQSNQNQLQQEAQQLLQGVQLLSGDSFDQDNLLDTIETIINTYQQIFNVTLKICNQLNTTIFQSGSQDGINISVNNLYDQYFYYDYAISWWSQLKEDCTDSQSYKDTNSCMTFVNETLIQNYDQINKTAEQLEQQLQNIQNQINQERIKQQQLILEEQRQKQEIIKLQEDIISQQQEINEGQNKYNQNKRKQDISLYIMIAIIVIVVIYNVTLCLVYHCQPKYEQQQNMKRRIDQIEKENKSDKTNQEQNNKKDDGDKKEQKQLKLVKQTQKKIDEQKDDSQLKYREVPKYLPNIRSKKDNDDNIIQETMNPIQTILQTTQLTKEQKMKYAEEQLKLEKGKHEQIYNGENIDIDKTLSGTLTRQQQQQQTKKPQIQI